ncbi:GMC oxidoreductase [Streptomyces lincolnensis]|uniref:GMC oxidoreductase n=1 Tax=Streptomyces TaxID=1883 RepID=UPI001E3A3BFF|nr:MULTISPECIES: GMC oxidoreductase [Streptomyces]MCD7443062.1 hypothetical protein [Streptomyces lincolnensis]WLW51665.1 GMC oxidoreductase [Streptomyces coralus]
MPEPNPPHGSDAVVADGTTLLDVAYQDPGATSCCKTLKNIAAKKYGMVLVGGGAVGAAVLGRPLQGMGPNKKVKCLVLERGRSFDLVPQILCPGGRAQFWSTSHGVPRLGPRAKVVLANGIVKPAGPLQRPFTDVLPDFTGTNLGGHVTSWFSAWVPRAAWPKPTNPDRLQTGYPCLRGHVAMKIGKQNSHIHLTVVSTPRPGPSEADRHRLIPDSFDQEHLNQLASKQHIGFTVHALGEWRSSPEDLNGSRVHVDHETTVLRFAPSTKDLSVRAKMDEATQKLVTDGLAKDRSTAIDQWRPSTDGRPGGWQPGITDTRLKDALVHNSGTLCLGSNPAECMTNLHGQLHTVSKVYVGGAGTFPTSTSWKPTPTAVAPVQRLADHLLAAVAGAVHD